MKKWTLKYHSVYTRACYEIHCYCIINLYEKYAYDELSQQTDQQAQKPRPVCGIYHTNTTIHIEQEL